MQTTFSFRLGLAAVLTGLVLLPACTFIVAEDSVCGDGKVTGPEECDGPYFTDTTCESLGFTGGHLVCNSFCRVETFNCHRFICGDAHCDPAESLEWCPEDCGDRSVECGDEICDPSESFHREGEFGCLADCPEPTCGNGRCEPPAEHSSNCPQDCDSAFYCGDGLCHEWEQGSNRCDEDCLFTGPECGNGTCESGENEGNCPQDCTNACNNNGTCEPYQGETTSNCGDCSSCYDNQVCQPNLGEVTNGCLDCEGLPDCGDTICDGGAGETADNCPFDCNEDICGDGTADSGEECDGSDFPQGSDCGGRQSQGDWQYESGDLLCDTDCTILTWLCFPRDLGAACSTASDCAIGTNCYSNVNNEGICTRSCTETSDCTVHDPGTVCTSPLRTEFQGLGEFCLRPCGGSTPCPTGLVCDAGHCYYPTL